MGKFEERDFPDAVDSSSVGWMMVEWRIMKDDNICKDCGHGNYSLNPNQFEDLPIGTTPGQAVAMLKKYIKNRREHVSTDLKAPVRTSLFLLKVVKVADITDDHNNLLDDVIQDIE